MATIKTRGIIIRRTNLGEADRILTIVTPERGKIRAVAKSVRRPKSKLGGYLELFRYNEYLLAEGRNLDIVTGATTIDSLSGLNQSLRRIALAYYVAEITDRLVEETQEAVGVFDLIYSTLKLVAKSSVDLDMVKSHFEINIVAALGFMPELDKCVECGAPLEQRGHFSASLGGLLCRAHKHSDPAGTELSLDELKIIRGLMSDEDISQASQPWPAKVSEVSSNFLEHILDRDLRSKDFLGKVADF